jgi:hypothetical protein
VDLLDAVSKELSSAQELGAVPLSRVAEALGARGESLHIDVGYVFQNVPLPELRLGQVDAHALDVHFGSGVGLVFYLVESQLLADGTANVVLWLQHNSERISESRARQICKEYEAILEKACRDADSSVAALLA